MDRVFFKNAKEERIPMENINATQAASGRKKKTSAPFSPVLARAWEWAQSAGIAQDITRLPSYEKEDFSLLKQKSMRLYAYTNRCVNLVMGQQHNNYICFALFNQDGILLKCYGAPQALKSLESKGISRLSDWRMESVGPNGVNLGLSTGQSMALCGNENYCQPLKDMAVYFSPCHLERSDPHTLITLGGVAVLCPASHANQDYLMLANSIAYDICLHFFMADTVEQFFVNGERGVLNVDENLKTGKKYIMYCDFNLFRVLGVPPADIYFKSLTELIDPPPANEQFWNILESRRRVNDFLISLDIQGRSESLKITTEPYDQTRLSIRGIRIYFSSMKFLAASISKKIGHSAQFTFDDLVGQTSSFQVSLLQAQRYAPSHEPVLISGELGSGRNMFAQAMHNASSRRDGPFVAVNCAALPREQMERQLFGSEDIGLHDVGNLGYLELANNGTLYLGEIEALPLEIQSLLLTAMVEKRFIRTGGHAPVSSDVRIIASTSQDLSLSVKENRFHGQLYYLLSTHSLYLPPLRARRQDISLLADYFIRRLCKKSGRTAPRLSPEAHRLLQKFPWNGNVRELKNVVESVAMLSDTSFIECEDIYEYINDPRLLGEIRMSKEAGRGRITSIELQRTLLSCHNNKKLTAQKLGISRRTLYRYLEKYALETGATETDEAQE